MIFSLCLQLQRLHKPLTIADMKTTEFAAGYDREVVPIDHGEKYQELMQEPRDRSFFFGKTLHMAMSGDTAIEEYCGSQQFKAYNRWAEGGLYAVIHALRTLDNDLSAFAMNEVNFHRLNYGMQYLWAPMLAGNIWTSKAQRRNVIDLAQGRMASFGIDHYMARHNLIDKLGGTEVLYGAQEEAKDPLYQSLTGRLQEFDAATVLLDVMRRYEDLTVVPAPMQFEGSTRKGRNADFIAIHTKEETAIGIQVKSRLHKKDTERADASRIIFIDGDTDLGNIRPVRFEKGSSRTRTVSWPGLISAKCVERIKSHGKGKAMAAARDSQYMLRFKMLAREHLSDITVDYRALSEKIGERVMNRLM